VNDSLIEETISFVKDEAAKFGAKISDSNKFYMFRNNELAPESRIP
jgi:hypothetical protein